MPHKRENYLEWHEYFMSIAFLSAQRSKDPRTQVGACIVSRENKIVGIGYNGMPVGCDDDKMPWNRAVDTSTENWLNSKTPYVCHAELNAVLNKNLADVSGCVIYVALFPCNMCAQIIVQSGINEVIFYSDKYRDRASMIASRRLLDMAGVAYRQFKPRQKKVVIDFGVIECAQNLEPTLKTDRMDDSVSSTSSNNGDVLNDNNINDAKMANNNNKGVENSASLTNHAEIQNLPANMRQEKVGQGHVEPSHSVASFEPWTISLLSLFLVVVVLFFNFLTYFYPNAIASLLEGIQRINPLRFLS